MNPVSLSFLQTSSGPARELQDFVHPEVALGCRSRSHRVGFIGSQDVQGCVIHLGKLQFYSGSQRPKWLRNLA